MLQKFFFCVVSVFTLAGNSQIYEVPNAIKEAGKKIAILQ